MPFFLLQDVATRSVEAATFFPNTLEGWLKIVLVYGVSTAATLAAVWRMMKKPLEININGLGDRVGRLELSRESIETGQRKMQDDIRVAEQDRKHMREQLGETKALANHASEQLTEIKLDIISHITASREAITEDVHKVRDEVTAVRERVVRVETTLDSRKNGSPNR